MKLPLLFLIQLCASVVHAPAPTLTITKDENAETLVGRGGTILLTPFTVSDMNPDTFYIATIDYATNGQPLANVPETSFPGIDELNRFLRNNLLTESLDTPRDIQVVLRVLKPSTNTISTASHQYSFIDGPTPGYHQPTATEGATFTAPADTFPPQTIVSAPVPFANPEVVVTAPADSFPPQAMVTAPLPIHNTEAIVTAPASVIGADVVASAHHQIIATKGLLIEVLVKDPIPSGKSPLAVARLLPPYDKHMIKGFLEHGHPNLEGIEITQKDDLIMLSAKNLSEDKEYTIYVRDVAEKFPSESFRVKLVAATKPQGKVETKQTRMIIFGLSILAMAVFLAAILIEMMLAKKKAKIDNREQTLNNLMNPNRVHLADKDPYQP